MSVKYSLKYEKHILQVQMEGTWDQAFPSQKMHEIIGMAAYQSNVRGIIIINGMEGDTKISDSFLGHQLPRPVDRLLAVALVPLRLPGSEKVKKYSALKRMVPQDETKFEIFYELEEAVSWIESIICQGEKESV